MEIGLDSFAAAFDENGRAVRPAARVRHLIEQIEHADEVGLDTFGVGEHHRREFLDSAQAVILGAAAVRTAPRCGCLGRQADDGVGSANRRRSS